MSKSPITYPKDMRARAVQDQKPLITIDFDDRHVLNGTEGAVCFQSPCSLEELKQVIDLFQRLTEGRRLKRARFTK